MTGSQTIAAVRGGNLWKEDWTAPEHIVSSGAYQMAWYVDYEGFLLIKNQNFYDAGNVQIDEVRWYFEETIDAWQMYLDGNLDTVNIPANVDYDRPQEIYLNPYQQTEYYGFSLSQPPFDDLLVRKAFIAAANRPGLVQNLWGNSAQAGMTFSPPGMCLELWMGTLKVLGFRMNRHRPNSG